MNISGEHGTYENVLTHKEKLCRLEIFFIFSPPDEVIFKTAEHFQILMFHVPISQTHHLLEKNRIHSLSCVYAGLQVNIIAT